MPIEQFEFSDAPVALELALCIRTYRSFDPSRALICTGQSVDDFQQVARKRDGSFGLTRRRSYRRCQLDELMGRHGTSGRAVEVAASSGWLIGSANIMVTSARPVPARCYKTLRFFRYIALNAAVAWERL